MNLNFDLKALLPVARKAQPYIFGLALIGVFAYTAFVVNGALNVTASEATSATSKSAAKINFDKNAIAGIKNLSSVSGEVPTGNLGTSNPF